ncbi:BrnT family toxin [Mesorhizobium sp. M0598]|uniref:BrnT family toxin n=1 Tax=Mesorhizobium sp. M0598 TaxID=2956968 RepID=UPI003338FB07
MNKFECDKSKARCNYDKHGIKFTDAGRALKSGYALTQRSPQSDEVGEERNLSITRRPDGRAIVVVWTPRKEHVRIISVRYARQKEQEAFSGYLQKIQ